jgi:glycosyltransferase involved in cell wall biosynthesis
MKAPRVSVLLAVRNGAATLPLALRSIALQTEPDWELLVYDDGSSDDTIDLVEGWASAEPRMRVFRSPESRGLGARLNELIDAARAPLIARMDADDVAYPGRLSRQAELLDAQPAVDLVGASIAVFRSDGSLHGKRWAPPGHEQIVGFPFRAFRIFHPTWMGRCEWFRQHRYSVGAGTTEDQDLLYRALPVSTYANVPDILLGYREDRVSLRRVARARWDMARLVTRVAVRRGRPDHALLHGAGHTAKAALDLVAVATGTHHRMLRQRAAPIDAAERADWERVWGSAQQPTAREGIASVRS